MKPEHEKRVWHQFEDGNWWANIGCFRLVVKKAKGYWVPALSIPGGIMMPGIQRTLSSFAAPQIRFRQDWKAKQAAGAALGRVIEALRAELNELADATVLDVHRAVCKDKQCKFCRKERKARRAA